MFFSTCARLNPFAYFILSFVLVFPLCTYGQGTLSFVEMVPAEVYAEQVNVNTAIAQELSKKLKGIGVKKAQLIVDYRTKHGRFARLEDLLKVKGIGPKTLEKNKQRIRL